MYNEKLIISIFFLSKYSKSEKQIIPKSNRKIIEREVKSIKHITWPLLNISRDRSLSWLGTGIYIKHGSVKISRDRSLSWLGTGTYIKRGRVKLCLWSQNGIFRMVNIIWFSFYVNLQIACWVSTHVRRSKVYCYRAFVNSKT